MWARIRTLAVVALAVALVVWFLGHADLTAVWHELQGGRLDYLAVALLATLMTYVIRAFRWQYLLRPLGRPHFLVCLKTTVIGFAASTLLPARAGEVLRPYLLARREGFNATATFASIVIERLLDLIAVLVLFGVFVLFFADGLVIKDPHVWTALKLGGLSFAAGSLVVLGIMMAMAPHPERLSAWALTIERLLPDKLARLLASLVKGFVEGLAVVRQPGRMAIAMLLSIPLWLSIAVGIWATSRALRRTSRLSGARRSEKRFLPTRSSRA